MENNPAASPDRRFRVLDLEVDLDRETVYRGKQRIELPELSFRLLSVLLGHAPHDVSKDDLIREVWGNVVVGDETLAQRVRLLRQALGEDSQSPRYFMSVRGRGYRLMCDAKPIGNAESTGISRTKLIASIFVVFAAAAVWFFNDAKLQLPQDQAQATSEISIAVLPFADLSAKQDHGYFADGMQEELLTRLTDIDGLQVLSRTSVEPYRSASLSVPEIAARLNVGAVIEGSVRVDEDRVRITVQLIDAAQDAHIWADNYDRELSVQNIFSIQEEVARQITAALQLEYSSDDSPEPVQLPTSSLQAYQAYLIGRHHTFQVTPDDLELAITYLQRATDLDPDFAEAYAVLGWSYSFLGTRYGSMLPRDAFPKAKEAALKALALDGELADARSLYADILTWYDWDFDAAEREYLKAMQLDPVNVLGYALFLSAHGRNAEAIELIERRLKAQPDDAYVRMNAAWRFLAAGQNERAIAEAELAGRQADRYEVIGSALFAMGETEAAIAVFEADLAENGHLPTQLSNLAVAYYLGGRSTEGLELLTELEAIADERFFSPTQLAAVYFAAGDVDRGFAQLHNAVDAKVRDVIFLRSFRMLNGQRMDPRYLELVQAIGFSGDHVNK